MTNLPVANTQDMPIAGLKPARVLVLNPPSIDAENLLRDVIYGCWCKGKRIGGARTPPHPLVQLSTVMRDDGNEVVLMDAMAQHLSVADVQNAARGFDAVIIMTSVMTFEEDAAVIAELKKVHPRLISIFCGAMTTFMPELTLQNDNVDVIVRREPEFIIRDVLREIRKDESYHSVLGIGYRDHDGQPVVNDYYPFIKDLDRIPIPDWSLLPGGGDYFNPAVKRFPYVTDLTTRGCPAKCTFCMSPGFYGNKVRKRSAKNVLEGFRRYKARGMKEVYLRDELFTTFRKRNQEICETMIAENMDLTWLCSSRVDTVDEEMLHLMRKAGCHTIKFGVESGVQEILDRVKKGIELDQVRETFARCKSVGMRTHAHMMIGHPGETEATIKQTLKFVREIEPTTVTFGLLTPYPGTSLFDDLMDRFPELEQGFSLNVKDLHIRNGLTDKICDLTAQELSDWVKKAHRDFYWRPKYIAGWLRRVESVSELKKVAKAGAKILDFSVRGDD